MRSAKNKKPRMSVLKNLFPHAQIQHLFNGFITTFAFHYKVRWFWVFFCLFFVLISELW